MDIVGADHRCGWKQSLSRGVLDHVSSNRFMAVKDNNNDT